MRIAVAVVANGQVDPVLGGVALGYDEFVGRPVARQVGVEEGQLGVVDAKGRP